MHHTVARCPSSAASCPLLLSRAVCAAAITNASGIRKGAPYTGTLPHRSQSMSLRSGAMGALRSQQHAQQDQSLRREVCVTRLLKATSQVAGKGERKFDIHICCLQAVR